MKKAKKLCAAILALALAVLPMTGAALAAEPAEAELETAAIAEETAGTETETAGVAVLRHADAEDASYPTLEAALAAAASGDTVVLTADYVLTDNVTVPSGVTLLIPYDGTYSTGTQDYVVTSTGVAGSAYVTLTVPAGTGLTVNGTLLVNGRAAGSSSRHEGVLHGNYGHIALNGSLTVADGGTLYARGIIDGSGAVTAQNGGTVYQMLQIKDWRGGTKSAAMVLMGKTFPFNEYEINNIRAAATYAYGSKLICQGYIYASSSANFTDAELVGSNGLFVLQNENAYCVSTYDETAEQLRVTCNGNVQINKLSVSIGSLTINSNNFICPISKHIGITAAGGTLTIKYNCKMLPGSYLTVNEDAGLVVSSLRRLYVYDADAYQAGFTYGAPAATEDAVLTINGTASGMIYSSDPNLGNIGGSAYTAAQGATYSISEYNNTDYVSVTFYRATLTANSAN